MIYDTSSASFASFLLARVSINQPARRDTGCQPANFITPPDQRALLPDANLAQQDHLGLCQICKNCKKIEQLSSTRFKKCSGCKLDYYCSKECQKQHWHIHKFDCMSLQSSVDEGSVVCTRWGRLSMPLLIRMGNIALQGRTETHLLLMSCHIDDAQRVRVVEAHIESIEELRRRDPDVYDTMLKERLSTMATGFVIVYFENGDSSIRLFQFSVVGPEQRADMVARLGVAATEAIYAELFQEPRLDKFVEQINAIAFKV